MSHKDSQYPTTFGAAVTGERVRSPAATAVATIEMSRILSDLATRTGPGGVGCPLPLFELFEVWHFRDGCLTRLFLASAANGGVTPSCDNRNTLWNTPSLSPALGSQ